MRYLALLTLLALAASLPALAQDTEELSQNKPVALISSVQGPCEVKNPDTDWHAAYWLTLLRPEDQLRVPPNGKVVVDFFADDHREILDPGTEAKLAFKNVVKTSPTGQVRKDAARDRAVVEIPIPYMMMRKLFKKDFEGSQDPDAMARENGFLAAYVKAEAFPPVFFWKATGAPEYRFQLFNEWDEFLYEAKTKDTRFKFPYNAPFRMAKNSEYGWQVLSGENTIVVRKYRFTLLTQLLAEQLERAERHFDQLRTQHKLAQTDYTDLFLLYNNRKMIDKYLHLLVEMSAMDPENPLLYRALVRTYLRRGCPAHAQEALDKELKLGGVDPLFD